MILREKVYINRVAVDYQAIYKRAQDYFHRHGVDFIFDFVQSDYVGLSGLKVQFPQGERYILHPFMANLIPSEPGYDIRSFVFNGREFTPPAIPTGYCYLPSTQPFIDILTDQLNPKDLDYVTVCHEHMHALVLLANLKGFNVQDVMDTYYNAMQLESADSNFGQQWQLLANFINMQPTYKYFQPSEIVGLKPELVQLLDKARGIAGVPFKITSGYRDPAHNAAVGGVQDSAHETGLAVDLAVADSVTGGKILLALAQVGFKRFGFYNDGHIHCDIDSTKPTPCYWIK